MSEFKPWLVAHWSTWMEDIPLRINRYGFMEETHFTIAYSPVPERPTLKRGLDKRTKDVDISDQHSLTGRPRAA